MGRIIGTFGRNSSISALFSLPNLSSYDGGDGGPCATELEGSILLQPSKGFRKRPWNGRQRYVFFCGFSNSVGPVSTSFKDSGRLGSRCESGARGRSTIR